MFCPQCGSQNEDDAAFCGNCGNPLGNVNAALAQETVIPIAAPGQDAVAANPGKRTKLIVGIAVAAVVIVALIAGSIVWFNLDQASKAKRAPHSILVTINATGYSDQDTLIPIRATGTDFDGKSVDELFFVNGEGEGVSLSKGEYELKVEASPLTADGILYKDVPATFPVTISEDLDDGAEVDERSEVVIGMEKSTALDETQEMIDAAHDAAVQDPDQVDKADALAEKAQQVHDEAVAAKQREEELARARQNPSSVNALNGAVTLKGKLVRQVRTTDETGMGWASVDYMLQFDAPVSITYRAASGETATNTFNRIQVESTELFYADGSSPDANIASQTIPSLQPYVGQYVAVTGTIHSTGNAHTYGNARFGSGYTIASI